MTAGDDKNFEPWQWDVVIFLSIVDCLLYVHTVTHCCVRVSERARCVCVGGRILTATNELSNGDELRTGVALRGGVTCRLVARTGSNWNGR